MKTANPIGRGAKTYQFHATTLINITNPSEQSKLYPFTELTYRNMGVPSVALGVSCREDSVDKDEGADNLRTEAGALAVAVSERVGAATVTLVVGSLEGLHEAAPTDCTEALCHHVQDGSHQGNLAGQEQPECNRRVYVPT